MVSFASVTSAVLWCFTVQLELLRADWPVELIMSEEGKELYGELPIRICPDSQLMPLHRATRRAHIPWAFCSNGPALGSAHLRAGPGQSSHGLSWADG